MAQHPNDFRSAFERREFIATAELVLGRDHTAVAAEDFVRDASQSADGIRVISITDLPGGNPALPAESFASFVLQRGLTPIAHLSGKDGNRSFLEGRLHGLARRGVEIVLALTGDAQKEGFSGRSKPVYDLDSDLILRLIQQLRDGLTYEAGTKQLRTTPFDFFAGAVVNPFKVCEPDLMMQFYKLQLKIAAGAQFVITQVGFNLRKLFELKQFMECEGLAHIPILANVYVPTAKVAQMMQSGEIAGCVVSDELIRRLEGEKKPQRLERAALMVAAARDLGFAGAHIGGFGLTHLDFMTILERAAAIGPDWRKRMDELLFPVANEFYLWPQRNDGLSDSTAPQLGASVNPNAPLGQRLAAAVHRHFIKSDSLGGRFFESRMIARDGETASWFWRALLSPSTAFRKATLGCMSCGDCIQDHLQYAGCSMRWCYKELRNGPCGGSRLDGMCEARADQPCIWNRVYVGALALGQDPRAFARVLIPPRDWNLDRSNALVNRFEHRDNLHKRVEISQPKTKKDEPC
jgi:methylenetetrahydrofolate reductase (NADPH)